MRPTLPTCETPFHAVMVDGIWIGTWCLLIALSNTGQVLAWQWVWWRVHRSMVSTVPAAPYSRDPRQRRRFRPPHRAWTSVATHTTSTLPVPPSHERDPAPHQEPAHHLTARGRSERATAGPLHTTPPSTPAKDSGNAPDGHEEHKHARTHPLFLADISHLILR